MEKYCYYYVLFAFIMALVSIGVNIALLGSEKTVSIGLVPIFFKIINLSVLAALIYYH